MERKNRSSNLLPRMATPLFSDIVKRSYQSQITFGQTKKSQQALFTLKKMSENFANFVESRTPQKPRFSVKTKSAKMALPAHRAFRN
jgi:hypothetical protein